MNTIHKFPISTKEVNFSLLLTSKARILDVQLQKDVLTAWVLLNTSDSMVKRNFAVYGTGWEMPEDLSKHIYVTTIQAHTGFVWHIFEILK